MSRPRLLDLFCGAGGAAMGYHRAGFDIVGVDNRPQPNYRFPFVQGDALAALEYFGHEFAAIHASPPCQKFSIASVARPGLKATHLDLVEPIRELLIKSGRLWVIENVPGAPLRSPFTLCGSMFDLRLNGGYLRRHRLFEVNFPVTTPPPHDHRGQALGVYGHGVNSRGSFGHALAAEDARAIMGMGWANRNEVAQGVPPAYTEWIGRQLVKVCAMD